MSVTEQRINDLLFMRASVLAEMRRVADASRVWKLYLLKRELDQELVLLTA